MNENVDKIITENHLVARTSIVENVQHIGRRLKKAEKKGAILNNVLDLMYDVLMKSHLVRMINHLLKIFKRWIKNLIIVSNRI